MSEPLYVHYHQQLVGLLAQTATRTMPFAYDDEWLRSADSFPISRSLFWMEHSLTRAANTSSPACWLKVMYANKSVSR